MNLLQMNLKSLYGREEMFKMNNFYFFSKVSSLFKNYSMFCLNILLFYNNVFNLNESIVSITGNSS